MKVRELICVVLTAGVAVGCGKDEPAKGGASAGAGGASGTAAGTGVAAGTAAGTAPGTAVAEGSDKVPAADQAAVQQVVDAWLAAQNGGDFAAYSALYADKMEGVKRVGARTWRFDRKGWLADRQRMFKNKMEVGARDVRIEGTAAAPVVELTQTFKQGKFADEGEKRIVLQKTPAGLRIAREEMLRSVVAGAMAAKAGSQLFLPVTIEAKAYAVLEPQARAEWGDGPLRGPIGGDPFYALRSAGKAPASWKGRELAVYDATGKKCAARIGALELAGGGTPHFGAVQEWEGFDGEPPWPQAQRARSVYEMGDLKLLGELIIDGGCAPVVIVDAASPAKVIGRAPDDPARTKAAIDAFRKLPGYRSLQTDFTADGGSGQWAEVPAVATFTDGTRTLVVVSAREGHGCGEFYGRLTGIFEETGGALKPLAGTDQSFIDVSAVVDLDGDGKVELLGASDDNGVSAALFEQRGATFEPSLTVEFPYMDCPC